MEIAFGWGGWVRVTDLDVLPPGALVYVRFERNQSLKRVVPVELYVESTDRRRLQGVHLRRLPLDLIEAVANEDGGADIDSSLRHHGPPLSVLASHFATVPRNRRYGMGPRAGQPRALTWVEQAWWSQVSGSGVPGAKRAREPEAHQFAEPEPLTTPPDGRYDDTWLRHLAEAYAWAVRRWRTGGGEAPAKALAAQAGVSVKTVHSWIYRARKAGFIPATARGQAG